LGLYRWEHDTGKRRIGVSASTRPAATISDVEAL